MSITTISIGGDVYPVERACVIEPSGFMVFSIPLQNENIKKMSNQLHNKLTAGYKLPFSIYYVNSITNGVMECQGVSSLNLETAKELRVRGSVTEYMSSNKEIK